MSKKLTQAFYNQSTLKIAKELLGKYLVREIDNQKIIGKIVETEAYFGFNDKASHASCGKTERNSIMFKKGGYWYVYVIYGIFNCLNITTEKDGFPSAVLIRALEPIKGIDFMRKNRKNNINLCSGPGRLCQALKIDRKLNQTRAFGNCCLWIENGEKVEKHDVLSSKRIGVDYAGQWARKKWRFYLKNNKFVSK